MLRWYTPADALTIGNASCGTIAIFLVPRATWPSATTGASGLDDRAARPAALRVRRPGRLRRAPRARTRQSLLGADLDLARPTSTSLRTSRRAVLGYTLGSRGGWDMLGLTYFVVCGVSRLARFNVTATQVTTRRDSVQVTSSSRARPSRRSILLVGLLALALSNGHCASDDLWLRGVAPASARWLIRLRSCWPTCMSGWWC